MAMQMTTKLLFSHPNNHTGESQEETRKINVLDICLQADCVYHSAAMPSIVHGLSQQIFLVAYTHLYAAKIEMT